MVLRILFLFFFKLDNFSIALICRYIFRDFLIWVPGFTYLLKFDIKSEALSSSFDIIIVFWNLDKFSDFVVIM